MARSRKRPHLKAVETLTHEGENRKNIPTAEYQPVMRDEELNPTQVAYERRNRDLDPQLVWRGKDEQDWSDLIVQAPPLYIQEKVHPKALIDDLVRHSATDDESSNEQIDLFADFNGLPEGTAGTEFYQHDANWSNRSTSTAWNDVQAGRTPDEQAAALLVLNREMHRGYTLDELPDWPRDPWESRGTDLHRRWWDARISRQKEIDASIAAKAEFEYLYDRPHEDRKIVRTAGPFTVESLSPHRTLGVDENDGLIDRATDTRGYYGREADFVPMILENLKTTGVQQAHKEDRLTFTSFVPWPGQYVCAEGRYVEGGGEDDGEHPRPERRAAIFVGPEFGTVSRPDLVAATREAGEANFDVPVACAFSYDAHSSEFAGLGRIPVLKARMNADLHMADDLKNTGKGNLFVIFGEPDIDILEVDSDHIRVRINGVDVFHPNTGEVRSDGPDGIACWFIDTDYNEESFFVRHAYFLGAGDPYKSLKTTLKAEIDPEAWATLHSDTSRPFLKPQSGRIAVKVINHLGDEVMKVFRA